MNEKKTVLITGSTSGIGLSMATKFAKLGHNIIFNGLEKDGAKTAQSVADEYGIQHLFYGVDITDTPKLREMIEGGQEAFGTIDILVNNAGAQFVCPVEDFPDEKWNMILNVNLTAAFHATKAVWKGMKEQGWGRIINIASAHGLVASEFKSAYIAAKHGLVGFTKTIALEGAPYGITANAICPGYVHTPIVEAQIGDQMAAHHMGREEVIKKVLLGKQAIKEFIPVNAISEMALYLASDAAAQMTGTAVPIDGGWTAQ